MSTAKEKFTFQVSEIRFSKDGFHIVATTGGDSVKGRFAAKEGMCYIGEGTWDRTSPGALRYGPTFLLESASMVRTMSPAHLGYYLAKKMKGKGLGEIFIGRLVEGCEEDNQQLEELLDRNERDILVEYAGPRNAKKVDMLLAAWPALKPEADVISPLLGYGLSEAMAEQMVTLYGRRAIEVVEEHPYNLILMLDGVSFITADRIASRVGRIKKTDPVRLRAALATGMINATNKGHIGVSRSVLLRETVPLVNPSTLVNGRRKLNTDEPRDVTDEQLATVLDDMIHDRVDEDDAEARGFCSRLIEFPDDKGERVVWYAPLVEAEQRIAVRLATFNADPRPDLVARIPEFERAAGMKLVPEQRLAVERALMNPVTVITGGPGVGKSATLRVLLLALESVPRASIAPRMRGSQAAPTGKAAKRIADSTGRPASTMHSLIGFTPGGRSTFNLENPLGNQFLVLDEMSMGDTELSAATLCAAPDDCRIVIVGDVDQLPSVGPGQVLRDLIRAEVVPVTRLSKVFRFGHGIIEAATKIRHGEMPETTKDEQFVFVDTDTPQIQLIEAVKDLLSKGVKPDDIQILAPTHGGDCGCVALNLAMQTLLNPEAPGPKTTQRLRRDSGDIRVGDRVIQNKNDKGLCIVNGDIGWISNIETDTGRTELLLADRDRPLLMEHKQTSHLKLAYAITVHKSQGAEAPYVLMVLDQTAIFMVMRSLVYTGVTRGSKKVMVFASRNTLLQAVRKGEPPEGRRRTSLFNKLKTVFSQKAVDALEPEFSDIPF